MPCLIQSNLYVVARKMLLSGNHCSPTFSKCFDEEKEGHAVQQQKAKRNKQSNQDLYLQQLSPL
jgi:hypothetical protein